MINSLHLGRKIVQAFSLFGPERLIDHWSQARLSSVLAAVEAIVYGKAGIEGFEAEPRSTQDRLLRRSFAQYLATRATYKSTWILTLQDLIFFFLLAGYVILLPLLSVLPHPRMEQDSDSIAILYHYPYLFDLVKDILPQEDKVFLQQAPVLFSFHDVCFLLKGALNYPRILCHPHFLFSLVKWISLYSGIIRRYRPKAILNFIEGSFVSSVLTGYLRGKGILHINHLHGEIFSSPRFAFSEFDQFMVYGEYWKNLFLSLKCRSEFIVLKNLYYSHLYQINVNTLWDNKELSLIIFHSYLLNIDTDEYEALCRLIRLLQDTGSTYFRFHPNQKESGVEFFASLQKRFKGANYSISPDPHQNDPIDMSLADATIAVGYTTAALFQAWVAGCKVIYLGDANDLRMRYQDSQNVLFLNSAISDAEIKQFITTPPVHSPHETQLIDHVAKIL